MNGWLSKINNNLSENRIKLERGNQPKKTFFHQYLIGKMLHNTQVTLNTSHVSLIDQLGLVRRHIYTSMSALQTEDVEWRKTRVFITEGFYGRCYQVA